MSEPNDETQWMIDGLRQGQEDVIRAFVDRYGNSLQAVADKNIATQMGRRFGPDDVVQSVCRTFVRRAQGGEFEFEDSEAMWRLLCAITLNKVREKARFHMRQKRSLAQEARPAATSEGDRDPDAMLGASNDPTPSEAVEFADTFAHLLSGLEEDERVLIDMKLQQKSNEEIADAIGCSDRTVRRMLGRLQERFEAMLETS